MQAILSDIRALASVTGVAILGKRDGRVEHLFPAAFTERHTERLLELVTQTYQRLRGFERLTLRFERVIVHLFNQPNYLLFVTVLPDTNCEHFETVVRSKFARIDQSLAQSAPAPGGLRVRNGDAAVLGGDPIATFIDIFNAISRELAGSFGMTRLAADWRLARDTAAESFESLTALTVDHSGNLALRRGRYLEPTAETIQALIALSEQFFQIIGTARTAAEEPFYKHLERNRELLEPYGTFLFLQQNRRPSKRR
ncbi:MAG TPA: hypothetical protein VLB27_06030 [candidate division Zixibacteria bacterium]|nr:hypothetical protein [candidate division Zixibacteria bacterium]